MEQLTYERRVEEKRMRSEISQAKRQAEFFSEQVEKGEKIRRLEERVTYFNCYWFYWYNQSLI